MPGDDATAALLDDISGATAQERFLVMINERVGDIEVAVREMRGDLREIHDAVTNMANFLTTDVIGLFVEVPSSSSSTCVEIDVDFLARTIAAAQRTRGIAVATACAIVYPMREDMHAVTIYLQLHARVVVTQVSAELNECLIAEFALKSRRMNSWTAASVAGLENEVAAGPRSVRLDTRGP